MRDFGEDPNSCNSSFTSKVNLVVIDSVTENVEFLLGGKVDRNVMIVFTACP